MFNLTLFGSDGTLTFDTSLDTSGMKKGASGLGDIAKNALGVFAGNMMTKAVEGVAALGKEALSSGMNFEAASAKTKTLFTGTDAEFRQLQQTMLDVSTASGLSADSIAEAAYSAESAGVSAGNLGTMLDSSSKLAAAGFTDMDTALSATAKTMNAYGMSGEEDIGKVQKVLMQTQNLGITTVGELGSSLAQVTPTAAAFGVSFEQVGASLAVMTAQGTPTAQATTQLNGLIAELGKSGTLAANNLTKAAEGSKYAGMSFGEMMDAGATLDEVLAMMQGEADKNGKSMVDMFSSIEAGKAALAIASEGGETFRKDLQGMSTDSDVVGKAYATVSDTLKFKSQQIKTSMSNIATSLFQMASGPLAKAADGASSALAKISKGLSENGLQGVADAMLGMMNKAADSIANFDWPGAARKIVDGITTFIDGDGVGKFLTSAGKMIQGLASGLATALPVLMPALVKLTAYILTSLIKFLPQLVTAGLTLIKGLAQGFLEALPDIWNALASITTEWMKFEANFYGQLGQFIAEVWSKFVEWGRGVIDRVGSAMSSMLQTAVSWLSQLPGKTWTWLVNTVTRLIQWGQNMVQNASTAMNNMLSTIISWVSQLPEKVWMWLVGTVTRLIQWGQNMVQNASAAMSSMLNTIISWVQQLPGRTWTWLVNTVARLIQWGQNMVQHASAAMSNMLHTIISWVQQLPEKVWTWLANTAQKVVSWGADLAVKGTTAAKGLFDAIVNGVKSLPEKMAEIGKNIVTGIWNGISSGWNWLKNKVADLADSLLDAAKDALDINSPSKEFEKGVGRWIPAGISRGVIRAMPGTLKTMKQQAARMVEEMQASVKASAGELTLNANAATGAAALASGGTIINNDNHVEQTNTYNTPVATPSETAKAQREAVRKLVGGVQ